MCKCYEKFYKKNILFTIFFLKSGREDILKLNRVDRKGRTFATQWTELTLLFAFNTFTPAPYFIFLSHRRLYLRGQVQSEFSKIIS